MGRLEPELDPWRDTRVERAPGRAGVTVLVVLVTVGVGVAALVSVLS